MDLKKYESYSIEDYIEDQDFRNWVLQTDASLNEQWSVFFAEHPGQKNTAEQARLLLFEMQDYFQPSSLKDKPFDEPFIAKLRNVASNQQRENLLKVRRRRFIFRAIAASLLFLLGSISVLWFMEQGQQAVATGYGECKSINLPDGSVVKLNGHSEIKFAKKWKTGDERKVHLSGEAYFEISKDEKDAKFTVLTNDLEVEVLGTSFNVHSRGKETKVFLKEGKVKLNLNGLKHSMEMNPGEFVAYSEKSKEQPKKQIASPPVHTSWKDGLMIFENKTLKEVLEEVEEIYGETIQVKNAEHYSREITTGIPVENLNEAISILELTLGLKITKEQESFIIH